MTDVSSAGPDTCGCCAGVEESTPQALVNRMGLTAIAYRIGEYAHFKESLRAGLSSSMFSELGALRTRDADDFTIGLLDAVSCVADVLTFYQERVANESYLRTATERVSLQEMAKLIGYRLAPGVAAETPLAFALEPPKTPPAGLPPDPGAFVTGIPSALTLAAGLQVQSIPGPGERPQTFETVEDIFARPEWNAARPWLSESRIPGYGSTEVWVKGVNNNLKPGDALAFVGAEFLAHPDTNNNWDFRLIDSVELDAANGRTRVQWTRGLGSTSPFSTPPAAPTIYVLRKRVGVFGNNAPMWMAMNSQFRTDYPGSTSSSKDWPAFTISPLSASDSGGYVDLDSVLSEVKPGSLIVLAKGEFNRPDENYPSGTYVELYAVTSTTEVSRAEFALSGKVTRLGVSGQNLKQQFFHHPRETSVYAQSEPLVLAPFLVTDAVAGDRIPLVAPIDGLNPGRRLIVTGKRVEDGAAVVVETTLTKVESNPNGAILTISVPLGAPLVRDTVVVHLNVALATHGETVSEVLGAGDASRPFQRFELKRTPLTYRSAPTDTGAAAELTVRVGDVEWTEKASLFGTSAIDRVYSVVTDERDKTWVAFGDGIRGARLPSGVSNIRATYRQGLGAAGNVGADTLSQLTTRPLGLKGASNPIAAQGGTDPESEDRARRTMPLGTRTLGRAVSVLDYEDFALAFAGVAKAQARVLQLPAGPTVAITVAGQNGAALTSANPIWNNLWLALKSSGDPHVNVALVGYQASTFRLGLKVRRDPAYEIAPLLAAVEAALRDHFSFDARELAAPVFQSDVIAVAHSVAGVVAVDLDFFYGGTSPVSQTLKSRQTRLLASAMRVSGSVALPAELLTLDPAPFDRLVEMV